MVNQNKFSNRKILTNNFYLRLIISFFIVLIITPFIVLAGISNIWYSEIYNYIFLFLLLIPLIWGIYEILTFVSSKTYFYLFDIFYLMFGISIIFIIFGILFLRNINYKVISGVTNSEGESFFNEIPNFWIPITIDFILVIIYLSYSIFKDEDIKNSFLVTFISQLLLLFSFSIFFITIIYGATITLTLLFTVAATDSFCYLTGKKFGKQSIFPKISPQKTREGLIYGTILALLFGIITLSLIVFLANSSIITYSSIFGYSNFATFFLMAIILFILVISSVFGDLFFSKIKRDYNKKDFSNLLPGHGGLLDRIDSHIFAFITASAFMILIF